MDKKIIRAALLGFGTVGTGVYKVLQKQKEDMIPKFGSQIEIKKILVRNLEKAAAKVEDPAVLTNNWDEIVNDPEIDIVIELIGGIEPARSYILAALNAGKHAVTANKDLIAVHGKELLDAAEANHVDFLFEAAVAGGIPIIQTIERMSCRQPYGRSYGYCKRYYKLYSYEDDAGWNGIQRCTCTCNRTWICRG